MPIAAVKGDAGDDGPNVISASTETVFNGLIKGNGTYAGQAAAGTDYQAPTQTLTAEATLSDSDTIPVYIASSSVHKKTTWSNIKEKLKTYFDTIYGGSPAFGSSTTNSTTGRSVTHTFGSIAAAAYCVTITPTLTAAPTTGTAGSLGEVYVVKNADGTFTVYNTGISGIAFDWQAAEV